MPLGKRSLTLPPRVIVDKVPSPEPAAADDTALPTPPPDLPPSPNDVQATDEMAGQLLGIKRALERVLGGEEAPLAAEASPDLGAENERLRAELTRAREDAAFVLARLDAAEADNLRLAEILRSREAELIRLKGLSSAEEEVF